MAQSCSDCNCPVDLDSNDVQHCRKGRVNVGASTDGTPPVQCCRCADHHWKEFCLFCIKKQHDEVMGGEKQHAINNKRKAAEELSKTDQELDAARKERQAASRKLETLERNIRGMEEERARLEEARKALDAKMTEAKREQARTKELAERQGQRILELEGNKKRRKTEELEATRVLEEVDKLLSPSRSKLHPSYWKLDCNADAAPPTEYPEVDPAERAFFQELIKTCCHDTCNLSSVRDSEVLRVFRIENKTQWGVYEAKKRKVMKSLKEESCGGTVGSSAGAAAAGAIPAVKPPLLTVGVQEFLKMEGWDAGAREVFLFHGMSSEGAAFEIADKGFNVRFAKKGMLGKGCYFTDEFCKAAFYANNEALEHASRAAVVLVCRVIMGHHFQVRAGQKERDATRPPRKCPCVRNRTDAKDCKCGDYYDSVVAQLDVSIGTVNHGPHREIAVYYPDLVYPEFVLVLGKASAAGLSAAQALAAQSAPRQPASAAQSVRDNVKAIVAAMKKNKKSAAAQEKGCAALKGLALVVDGNRTMIAAEGGIEAVIAGMGKHGGSAGVQEQGCATLRKLSINIDNRVKIGAAGGIEVVIAGMGKHVESAGVQEQGCWALCNLSFNIDNRVKIRAAGGMEAVKVAMQKHASSSLVQSVGIAALKRLQE